MSVIYTPETFEPVVLAILDGVSSTMDRRRAEAAHMSMRRTPDMYFQVMLTLMTQSSQVGVRQFCAVMLRQVLNVSNPMWGACSAQTQAAAKSMLIEVITTEENEMLRDAANHVVGRLAAKTVPVNQWPELLPVVTKLCETKANAPMRESGLNILAKVAEYGVRVLTPAMDTMKAMLVTGMHDESMQVRFAGMRCAVAFIIALHADKRHLVYDLMLPAFTVCQNAYEADDDIVSDMLQELSNVVTCDADCVRDCLDEVMTLMFQIVNHERFDESTRIVALEFLLTLLESGKAMVRAVKQFTATLVPLCFTFLMDLEEDLDRWSGFSEDADAENHYAGVMALERCSGNMDRKEFMELAMPIINNLVVQQDWRSKFVGILAISRLSDSIPRAIEPIAAALVEPIAALVNDPHPRVAWVALHCLTQFCVDFEEFQMKHHATLVPAFLAGMQVTSSPRVPHEACAGIVDYCNTAVPDKDKDSIDAKSHPVLVYADDILNGVMAVLKLDMLKLQENAVSAVSAVARTCGEEEEFDFGVYYDTLFPLMQETVGMETTEDNAALKGKAVEALGFLVKAVGGERFAPDAEATMGYLLNMYKSSITHDNPMYFPLLNTLACISHVMEGDFVIFLSHIIPNLLEAAQQEGFIVSNGNNLNVYKNKEGWETSEVQMRGLGEHHFTVNSGILDDVATTCKTLANFSDNLEEHYFPYVADTAQVLVPLINYKFNSMVRSASQCAMASLMKCCKRYSQTNNNNDGAGVKMSARIWAEVMPAMLARVKHEVHFDDLSDLVSALAECVENLLAPLSSKDMNLTFDLIDDLLYNDQLTKREREQKRRDPNCDEAELEEYDDADYDATWLVSSIHELMNHLSKNNPKAFMVRFHGKVAGYAMDMLRDDAEGQEVNNALCILGDTIENCAPQANKYISSFYQHAMRWSLAEDPQTRQAALWAIGACAYAMGPEFIVKADEALGVLMQVINHQDARSEDNTCATDDAIGAVGKIARYVLEGHAMQESVLDQFMAHMPIEDDQDEAKKCLEHVLHFMAQDKPSVGKNLPHVAKIFALHASDKHLATDASRAQMAQMVSHMNANKMVDFEQILDAEEMNNLQELMQN